MNDIKAQLRDIIKQRFAVDMEPNVTVAPAETGADYASNIAMQLAKVVRRSPKEIAEELQADFAKREPELTIEVALPGFLNFRLADKYFEQQVAQIAQVRAPQATDYQGKTVITEFSDPNPFKVLHVGHLYTSVVGDAISRILERAGAKVVRANFGGDVGLHVGKTMWAVMEHNYTPDELTIEKIAACYVEGTAAYEDDAAATVKISELNKTIYRIAAVGEAESVAWGGEEGKLAELYWRGRALSYAYFDEFYARIGLKFDKYYPESMVAERGLEEVRAHIGTTYTESDGAVVYLGEKVGLHTRVFINREGVPTYEAKDVGLIFTKWDDWHFDESIVITGSEQGEYMKVVLASIKEYAPELVERSRHFLHGLVKLPGNVKMSSRKGNFLKAVDVIELVQEALAQDKGTADEKVVMAAIKYAFLKYKLGGNIVFDPHESVSMNGNSGVYLLYSAVRAKKILQKAKASELNKKVDQELTGVEAEYTRRLNKKIVQYDEVLESALAEKAPYKICNYLYELAQEFSRFYEKVQVVGNANQELLLPTVQAYLQVMEQGLELLGIEIPEKM